jgi:formylglycine-generating enzyme required for sulfatase activity
LKRTITHISDPETVGLRIEFGGAVPIAKDDWLARLYALQDEFELALGTGRLPFELGVAAQAPSSADLLVGWIGNEEAEAALDCVERVFPEATAAHLGDGAFPELTERYELLKQEAAKSRREKSQFVFVKETVVEFEDGHKVTVAPFWIARRCVTVGQFLRFVEETGYVTTAERRGDDQNFRRNDINESMPHDQMLDSPVSFVSKADALAYCEWSSTRLPSEAEWLAAMVIDWTPLAPGQQLTADQEQLCVNSLEAGAAEWTNGRTDGISIVRSSPRYFLMHNWNRRGSGGRPCPDSHHEVVIGFRVARDTI